MFLSVFMGPFSQSPSSDVEMVDMCLDHARLAAQSGFAMVTFGEQHLNGYEPYCNPFMMGAQLAPDLGNTWFGITACPFVLRSPLRLAEDISVLDLLLRGRLVVGLSGGRPAFTKDFEIFGIDPEKRDAIYREKLEILLKAWAHQPGDAPWEFEVAGEKGAMHGRMMPAPWRANHPLLAFATSTDTTIADAGSRGWPVFLGPMPRFMAAQRLAAHRNALAAADVEVSQSETAANLSACLVHVIIGEDEDAAWNRAEEMNSLNIMIDRRDTRSLRELASLDMTDPVVREDPFVRNIMAVKGGMIVGTAAQVAEQLRSYESDGIRNIITRFTFGPPDRAVMDDNFRLFRERVMPELKLEQFPALPVDAIHPEYRKGIA